MDLRLDAFVVSFALVATVAAAQDEATPTDASSEPQHFGEEIVVTGSPTSAAPNVDCLQAVCAGQARTRPRLECDPYRAGRPRVKCRVRSRCAVTRAVTDAVRGLERSTSRAPFAFEGAAVRGELFGARAQSRQGALHRRRASRGTPPLQRPAPGCGCWPSRVPS